MRVRTGGIATPAGLINLVARLTEPARQAAGSDALWVGAGGGGLRAWFDTGYELTSQLRAWASRHGLDQLDDHGGGTVRLDLRRIRKSVRSRRYLQTGGVLDDFAAGHTKAVAAAHYADIDAHNALHDQAVEDGLRQALAGGAARPGHRHRGRRAARRARPGPAAADAGPAPGCGQRRPGRVPGVLR